MGVTGVDAQVDSGKVVLSGTAVHSSLAEEASKLAAEFASVKEVQNRMESCTDREVCETYRE